MLGKRKTRQENLFAPVRRETRVSRELKMLKGLLDFEWLREACKDKFCESNGRPSIAPETLGAMLFLGFWYDIDSDRELCDECDDRLSFREFIGISDEDEVPVHSSLTHWRKRLGRAAFEEFLRKSIQIAVDKGMKPGRCRMYDSSMVKAQADAGGQASATVDAIKDANDYLDALGDWEVEDETKKPVRQYRDREGTGLKVSGHDPDARYLSRRGKKRDFYHKCHFGFDSRDGLVMSADAGHKPDAEKMLEFLEKEEYVLDTVVADTGYFSGESQRWLKEQGICSHISVRDNSNRGGRVFGLDAFAYDAEGDEYVCPAGERLRYQGASCFGEKRYASRRGSCESCEFSIYCFCAGRIGNRRQLTIGPERELVEEAKSRNLNNRYRRLKVKRSIICEGSIGTMKSHGGLGRARWLGEEAMAIQALMAGVVHNLKKVVKFLMNREKSAKSASEAVVGTIAIAKCVLLEHIEKKRLLSQMMTIAA